MDPQTTNNNVSPLLSVPLEVLLQIVHHLTTPEYGNLRLTCKHIEETLLTAFSKEFFTKRQFMFTEFSLQALIDISKSRFSSSLSNVIFGLERPSKETGGVDLNTPDPTASLHARENRLQEEWIGFMTLLNTGQDVEMLAEAFSNLRNLEAVGMRDFNSRSRRRDHPHTEWQSYGVRTFELETGAQLGRPHHSIFPSQSIELDIFISRIFLNILRALGRSTSRPDCFEVILRQYSLYDHSFNLPKYVEPVVDPVLSSLRTLFLDLNWDVSPIQVTVDTVTIPCPSYLLRKFLAKLRALEHLRLNFGFHPGGATNEVLSWLSKPISSVKDVTTPGLLPLPPPPVHFANLRQLDIGMVRAEPRYLLAVIRKYQSTLRVISFHKVALLQTNSSEAQAKANLWVPLFGQLSKLNLNLSAINMSVLSQRQAWSHREWQVIFKDARNPRSKTWAGNDTQSGLRDYADLVVVEGLDVETESEHSDESDEDMPLDDGDMANSDSDGENDD